MTERTVNYKAHPDDEGIDRIEIVAVPRYKTSGLSGDEWRVGASVRFYRKGVQVHEDYRSRLRDAAAHLAWLLDKLPSESDVPALWALKETECHQFGCAEPAEVVVRLKSEYSRGGDGPLPDHGFFENRRAFCARHARRGDSGLEDNDRNYEQVSGSRPAPQADDESPAAFGGVIDLRSAKEES